MESGGPGDRVHADRRDVIGVRQLQPARRRGDIGRPEIDRSAVRDFLFHGYIPAPKTIYQGIAKLPAGHTLTWEDGRVTIERYWRPSAAIVPRSEDDALQRLDEVLRLVVPAHTLSDVPVGVFLSGGMDSALAAYYLDAPRTFSLGFDARDRSELDAARAAALHLHTVHTEMIEIGRAHV